MVSAFVGLQGSAFVDGDKVRGLLNAPLLRHALMESSLFIMGGLLSTAGETSPAVGGITGYHSGVDEDIILVVGDRS